MEISVHFRGNSRPLTTAMAAPLTCKWIRQNSGLDHYAHVELLFEPFSPGGEAIYSWEAPEDEVPIHFFDAVLEGIKRAMEVEESPYDHFVSTRIRVIGGSFNEIDSRRMDFAYASYIAVQEYVLALAKP